MSAWRSGSQPKSFFGSQPQVSFCGQYKDLLVCKVSLDTLGNKIVAVHKIFWNNY